MKVKTFLGPETAHPKRFWAPKNRDFHGPTLAMARVMDLPKSKTLHTGPYQSEVHREFYVHELPGASRAHNRLGGGSEVRLNTVNLNLKTY